MLRQRALAALAVAAAVLPAAACTPSADGPAPAVSTVTHTVVHTADARPVDTGPTTSADGTCGLIATQTVADDVGMRLARVTVQRSGGKQVGCTFYALEHPNAQCDATCLANEDLPGPKQPVVAIALQRYASQTAAHNAMVTTAEAGTNPQQVDVGGGRIGLAYQIPFYSKDDGKDWACAFYIGTTLAVVRTVTVNTSFNAVAVAKHLAAKLR